MTFFFWYCYSNGPQQGPDRQQKIETGKRKNLCLQTLPWQHANKKSPLKNHSLEKLAHARKHGLEFCLSTDMKEAWP